MEEPRDKFWHERARWIKFQETAEEDGHRWSKPHITLMSLPTLMQMRSCFKLGSVLLEFDSTNFAGIIGNFAKIFFVFLNCFLQMV